MNNKEYRPTLAQLRTFVTIAECRHFGTAAAKLEISQPSLSQALVALEAGLGVQLIERSTRKVIVTPSGQALLPYAKATLDAADSFLFHARGVQGTLTGPLTFGIIPTAAPYLLLQVLPLLAEEYPELEPHIVEDKTAHLLSALREGSIDVALIALPSNTSGMKEIPLYEEDFVVVVPEGHPLANRQNLSLATLNELNLLLLDDGHCLRDQIVDLCKIADVNVDGTTDATTRASSLTTVMQLVNAGLGATLVPLSAVSSECTRPSVATANFKPDVKASRRMGLVFRSSSSRAEEFEQLADVVRRAYSKTVKEAAESDTIVRDQDSLVSA